MREAARERGRLAAIALVSLGALAAPGGLRAQDDASGMAAECYGGLYPSPLHAMCNDAALFVAGARAGIGLVAAQGSAVPGSASTLGRRMASSPRVAFSLRPGIARAPLIEGSFWARALEGAITVGVLEGWSPMPTVGGFLSLDLIGSIGLIGLPSDRGFDRSVEEVGYGARVGVFRESFTLPGVSASVARRHVSEIEWGTASGDGAHATFRPLVTSLRATVAKDLLAFGVLGGWGWDRYAGEASLDVRRTSLGVQQTGSASSEDFHTDRQLLFGGLSYTLLVLQLSAEGGWAKGWSGPQGSGGWDPGAGSFFGSVAARLTY
jgi:hypothetical protein